MQTLETMTYEVTGRIARITLNRPRRGNGITFDMPDEPAACVEKADLDPAVHVIALAGDGKGFCGGYDLVASAEQILDGGDGETPTAPVGSALDPMVQAVNHLPGQVWDPMVDYQMMSRTRSEAHAPEAALRGQRPARRPALAPAQGGDAAIRGVRRRPRPAAGRDKPDGRSGDRLKAAGQTRTRSIFGS